MDDKEYIEFQLDFSDCETVDHVVDAACKLLVDNFHLAFEKTYIQEIIEQACHESYERDIDFK